MRKIVFFFLCFFLIVSNCYAITNTSKSYVVMDVETGRVLAGKNENSKMLIASITKIMTCVITLENIDINEKITVGEEVLGVEGTNIFISVGEVLTVEDLLYGLMLRSGNDAAIVLAVNVFSSEEEFVEKMNQKASDIGMKNTVFKNPHGLDDNTMNYSTAYDMALLSRYAYNIKKYREIVSTKKYVTKSNMKSYIWYNRVSLLNQYKYCIGGKNGYTPKAGKTLVSLAKKENLVLTIVSLDDDDIYTNHKNIYNDIFNKCYKYKIIDKNVFFINSSYKNYYLKKSFEYPLCQEEIKDVSTLVELYSNDNINQDDIGGKINILLNNNKIGEVFIYKKEDKKKKELGLFQNIKSYLFDRR